MAKLLTIVWDLAYLCLSILYHILLLRSPLSRNCWQWKLKLIICCYIQIVLECSFILGLYIVVSKDGSLIIAQLLVLQCNLHRIGGVHLVENIGDYHLNLFDMVTPAEMTMGTIWTRHYIAHLHTFVNKKSSYLSPYLSGKQVLRAHLDPLHVL